MPRPLPPKDPEGVKNLIAAAEAARGRLPNIVAEIVGIIRKVDPIELLAQLTLLYQTHIADEQPNRDKFSRWQVRIEWLVWLVLSEALRPPPSPQVIDGSILTPLDSLLDDYVMAVTMSLHVPVHGLSEAQDDMRVALQLDAVHVRGEAFQVQFEELARDVYAPHDIWCGDNLGIRINDAVVIANDLMAFLSNRIYALKSESRSLTGRLLRKPETASDLELQYDLPAQWWQGLGREQFEATVRAVVMSWTFPRALRVVGFTKEELVSRLGSKVNAETIDAFLSLISAPAEAIRGTPSLLQLTPLAKTPLIRVDGKYFVFVPALVIHGVYYAFHSALFAHHRAEYDGARATWLESAAI